MREEKEKRVYLDDCATRSISCLFAMPALFMSLAAAATSSSAMHSSIVRGLFADAALAPSVMCLIARSILRCGATSTDKW